MTISFPRTSFFLFPEEKSARFTDDDTDEKRARERKVKKRRVKYPILDIRDRGRGEGRGGIAGNKRRGAGGGSGHREILKKKFLLSCSPFSFSLCRYLDAFGLLLGCCKKMRSPLLVHHQLEVYRATPLESIVDDVVRPSFALDVDQYTV